MKKLCKRCQKPKPEVQLPRRRFCDACLLLNSREAARRNYYKNGHYDLAIMRDRSKSYYYNVVKPKKEAEKQHPKITKNRQLHIEKCPEHYIGQDELIRRNISQKCHFCGDLVIPSYYAPDGNGFFTNKMIFENIAQNIIYLFHRNCKKKWTNGADPMIKVEQLI